MRDFQIGDIVRLKSGGPKMTVQRLNFGLSEPDAKAVDVAWFAGEALLYGTLRVEGLAFVSEHAEWL